MVEILCYVTKEKQGLFGRSLASSGQVSMPTSNFNKTLKKAESETWIRHLQYQFFSLIKRNGLNPVKNL